MPESIRVLLVDDQRLMREGLRILMELEPDVEIVGEAENGAAALQAYAALQPDVVLMDVRMPGTVLRRPGACASTGLRPVLSS